MADQTDVGKPDTRIVFDAKLRHRFAIVDANAGVLALG